MATGVGLAQISLTQLNSPTTMSPPRGRNWACIAHTSWVTAYILLKFSNFRCHGNMGWSGTNFTSTVKFADPDNPLLGQGMGVVSSIQVELLSILCSNFQIFVAMATGVGLPQILLTQLNSPTPITPYQIQEWVSYLPYKPSYCQFCVQITVVGCHDNKGQSGVNLKDTVRLPDPANPQFGANSVHVSSKGPELGYSSSKLP